MFFAIVIFHVGMTIFQKNVDSPFATLKQVIRVESDLKIKRNARQCLNLDIY
jgi:hypothetical protein